jgi:hypothetical protein
MRTNNKKYEVAVYGIEYVRLAEPKHNKPLVPTRTGAAPVLAARRPRHVI